jgi:hypothetical protein
MHVNLSALIIHDHLGYLYTCVGYARNISQASELTVCCDCYKLVCRKCLVNQLNHEQYNIVYNYNIVDTW